MGKVKHGAFAAFGWAMWNAGSKLGWRYAKQKVQQRQSSREREADAAERQADAAERTAKAAERTAEAADKDTSSS